MKLHATLLCLVTGCASATRDHVWVADTVTERTGSRLKSSDAELPDGLDVTDGLSADEAVQIATWRSPALRAELTALDTALADFDEARRPANPRLNFLAPIDPRQLAAILLVPIDAVWQVPFRVAASNRELERVAEAMVQLVLDLERDIRVAHADAIAARERYSTRVEIEAIWADARRLAEGAARAGDIAFTEAASVAAEAELACDAAQRARYDMETADARLVFLLGAPWPNLPRLANDAVASMELDDLQKLVDLALAQRAELRAAELAVHAAAARGRWERSRVASIIATIDGQANRGELKPQFSIGFQAELPIFGRNPGGVGRADAALERAVHRYAFTRTSVVFDEIAARAAVLRAQASAAIYDRVAVAVSEAKRGRSDAFQAGADSYLVVIDALRRESETRMRRIDIDADLRRARADLARAVGGYAVLGRS